MPREQQEVFDRRNRQSELVALQPIVLRARLVGGADHLPWVEGFIERAVAQHPGKRDQVQPVRGHTGNDMPFAQGCFPVCAGMAGCAIQKDAVQTQRAAH